MFIRKGELDKVPVKVWRKDEFDVETSAWEQINHLTQLPFTFHHVAIMPDVHSGYGMPIGGVLATKGCVIPNAVGVDIGCGMCAVKTSHHIENVSQETLKTIMGKIRAQIPVGREHRRTGNPDRMPARLYHDSDKCICTREYQSATKQMGTLGGGNHFIEIQKDEEGFIWVMIHSGSRNLGKQVADYYNKIAATLNKRWFSTIPPKWELAFLPLDCDEASQYIAEMLYCVDFALANRKLMMEDIQNIFDEVIHPAKYGEMINIAHNYAQLEHHFGSDVMVHRKGATLARLSTIGIIPGSQGTSSYVVRGLGNVDSFTSCSHGAGRKMGRKEAERTLSLEEQKKIMDEQGIIHGIRNASNLDEAPGAYKDVVEVMELQKDLVQILHTLKPLAVIKGD